MNKDNENTLNYNYFCNDEQNKLQWLSIYLQCQLANLKDTEIDEDQLFAMANSAWYTKTKGVLSKHEFIPVLNIVVRYKMVFNLSLSPLHKFKLASSQLKLASSDMVNELGKLLNTPISLPTFKKHD